MGPLEQALLFMKGESISVFKQWDTVWIDLYSLRLYTVGGY